MKQEKYLQLRPKKTVFASSTINRLRNKAIENIKDKLLPDKKILKIVLIGSSVKNTFGRYVPPGFRGSLYSDFDFIVFVNDDYKVPKWLNGEPNGKPFQDNKLNLAFRNNKFIEGKYDIEVFFIRESSLRDKNICKFGEMAGIPMTNKSKHKNQVVFEK